MSGLLEQLRSIIETVVLSLGYGGIGLVMFIENLFPPLPSELVLPFAGFLVGQGTFSLLGVLIASTLGTLLGALALYHLGVWWGAARIQEFVRRYGRWALVDETDFLRSLHMFRRHDRSVVFWARFLPGARSLISIPAGVARMPLGSFLLFTTLGTLIWNGLLTAAGLVLSHNWTNILAVVDRFEWPILFLGAVLVLTGLARRIARLWRSAR